MRSCRARVWNIRCWLLPFSPIASESRPPAKGRRTKQFIQLLDWLRRQSSPLPPLLAMLIRFAPCCWMVRWRDWIMTQESTLNCRPYSVNSVYIATRRAQTVSITYFHTAHLVAKVACKHTHYTTPVAENLVETTPLLGLNYSLFARRETEEINHTLCTWISEHVNHKESK